MSANPKGKQLNFKFLSDLNLDQDVANRLTAYLNNVVKGYDTNIMSPIAQDYGPNKILKDWDQIFVSNSDKINDALKALEISNREKSGPRSLAKPWSKRIPDVLAYFGVKRSNVNYKSMQNYFNKSDLRPIKITKAINHLKNDTNSGLPFYKRKSLIKSELIPNFDNLLRRKDPAILFTRTQEGYKTRTVWGFPVADTLNEMMYYRPLLEYQKKLDWRSALVGPDEVDKRMTEAIKFANSNNLTLVSADFSAYDASISEILTRSAFEYIKELFQYKYSREIDYLCDRFLNISLLTPSGIYKGKHGVPSGSTFTNEVDSIIQYLVASSSNINLHKMQIQGDDGLYVINEADYDKLVKSFTDAGLTFNKSKSYLSKDYAVYLQCLYHKDYEVNGLIGGIYPIYRALNRIMYQERFTDIERIGLTGMDYYSIRTISILENCKYHPLFKEFVKFIQKMDKYNLEFTQKGVSKYSELLNQTSGSEGIIQNQYGDDVRGIKSFETYKVLKGL